MTASNPQVLIGRRYLERGFLDAALNLFARNPSGVEKDDWSRLAERLMDRQRIADAVRVCGLGEVEVPRERLLALGDRSLRRRDFDGAIRFYEFGTADRERWTEVVTLLTGRPDRAQRAVELAGRYLVDAPAPTPVRIASNG